VRLEIRLIITIHYVGLGKLAHVLGRVDEEHIHVLHDEIERRLIRQAEKLRCRRIEQLEPHPKRRLEIASGGQRIRGKANPERILATGEQTHLCPIWNVVLHTKDAMHDAMRFEEYGAQCRALPALNAAPLDHVHEHGNQ
jgi:hypothetical protein